MRLSSARRSARWRAQVTALVHGDEQVARAERAAAVLFSDDIGDADVDDVLMVFEDAPSTELALRPRGCR